MGRIGDPALFVGLLAAHPTFVIAGERVGAERRPMTGSAKQSNLGVVAALLAMTGLALRRRHLLRREAAVEGLALGGHVDQKLWRGEARAVFGLELMAELDEFLRAHKIDVGQRTTGKRCFNSSISRVSGSRCLGCNPANCDHRLFWPLPFSG